MSLRLALPFSRAGRLALIGALALGALLLSQAAFGHVAHADPAPGGTQQIIVGGGNGPGNGLSISTDYSFYTIGNQIRVCYSVPMPGYMQIMDKQGGYQHLLRAGYDDGYGDCFWGVVTPPDGKECLTITFWFPWGGSDSRTTCFTVFGNYPI